MSRSVIIRTCADSSGTVDWTFSTAGPIATESSFEIAEAAGDSVEAVVVLTGSVPDEAIFDKSLEDGSGVMVAFGSSLSAVIAGDVPIVPGMVEEMGEVTGIETSLRRPPCEPAPAPLDVSRSLISTAVLDGGCDCEVEDTTVP